MIRETRPKLPVLGFTVRQCVVCRRILRWPILDMADPLMLPYLHCEKPTEYLETVTPYEDDRKEGVA